MIPTRCPCSLHSIPHIPIVSLQSWRASLPICQLEMSRVRHSRTAESWLLRPWRKASQQRLAHYGALFIGGGSAEVLGDYGGGPNHVLPTAGTARSKGGLSVYTFLRVRTWLRIDDCAAARPVVEDAAWFARVEGLEAHARAAVRRLD